QTDRRRQQVAAARAAEHLVSGHQVRRLRTALVLQHADRRAFLRRRGWPVAARLPFARLVLIPPLPILALALRRPPSPRMVPVRYRVSRETRRDAVPTRRAASACRDRASDRWSESGCTARASRVASASPSIPIPAGSPRRPPS